MRSEPDELSPEDIIYKLGRMVTGTMYSLLEMVEEKWGKEAARETAVGVGSAARTNQPRRVDEVTGRHESHAGGCGRGSRTTGI